MKIRINRNFDWQLFGLWMLLLLIGLISIFSASTTKLGQELIVKSYYWKQLIWVFIALINLYIVLKIPLPVLDMLIIPLYGFSILSLIVVLFMPPINGAHRWIFIGSQQFQPSELAKVVMILLVARLISKEHISEWKMISKSFSVVIVPVVLIFIEPDFGTTLVFWASLLMMLAQAGFPYVYLIILISPIFAVLTSFSWFFFLVFILILVFFLNRERMNWIIIAVSTLVNLFIFVITPVLWNNLHEYQKNRILTFLDPTRDPLGAGYHVIQSKIAVGSGQFFGKGFLMGSQKNMNFLPEHHTDFIFSVIGEEFGFIGCGLLLVIFYLFFTRIIYLIKVAQKKEHKIAIAGILGYLLLQMFINIGMNLGIMPTKGIPLPFISYGGTNLIINSIAVSMILKYSLEKNL